MSFNMEHPIWIEIASPAPSIAEVREAVCRFYRIPEREMLSTARYRRIARPRQIAMALARQMTTRSLPAIGKAFGGRDHTTVLHAMRKIERLSEDPHFAREISRVRSSIEAKPTFKASVRAEIEACKAVADFLFLMGH
jgi:hypothetical protein